MNWRGDDRAQSVQVGAILLFATLVIALSIYQATIVPSQNADIEYKHSQTVQNQLTDVRNGILRSAATGTTQPASVTLGTQYPARVFLLNPPPSTGTLSTTDPGEIRLSNVAASNPETDDFFQNYSNVWRSPTKALSYEPDYSEYDNAPTLLYESSVLSNYYPSEAGDPAIPVSNQLLVNEDSKTITLVALNGSLSTTRADSVSVEPEALSAPYQPIPVEPASGTTMTLTVPTRVANATLASRTSFSAANVGPGPTPDTVNITLTGNYTLRTAKVGVGSRTTEPDEEYLTLVESEPSNQSVTVEVRDRYNNPVSGVRVDASSELAPAFRRTGDDGRATFKAAGGASGRATLEILDGDAQENVTVDVEAAVPAGPGGASGRLVQTGNAFAFDGDDPGSTPGGLELTLENTYGSTVNITDVTVEPEDVDLNGLSDKADGRGYGQSELNVRTLDNSSSTAVEALLPDNQYLSVTARGLTLSLTERHEERIYDTNTDSTGTVTTEEVNGSVSVSAGEKVELAFAEFRDVSADPTTMNVSNDDFRVSVTYTQNGTNKTDDFLVYAQPPRNGESGESLSYQTGSGTTSSPNNDDSGVVFTLENGAGQNLDITSITVDDTTDSSTAGFVETSGGDGRYNHEAFFNVVGSPDTREDPEDGYVDEGSRIDIGQTVALDNLAQLGAGDTVDVYLYQFVNSGNSANGRNLSGDDVTVTVEYELADGTTGSYTFTFTA